ncbi:hypothetical protein DL93DRAFT_2157882 [Clavulina sp. PMI_390]|nr:hypothetical protein DL93DRAFT_2157882 [Clavulina sp. PMI_390]
MTIAIGPVTPPLAAAVVSSRLISPSIPPPETQSEVVLRIVAIIENYLLTTGANDQFNQSGRKLLALRVNWHVSRDVPLELVLPAFPFKSPSSKKVLGVLPDFAEEIVLRRLEDICRSIETVYSAGAYLNIVSDGIVYGELVGVPDARVYQYNAELRSVVRRIGLSHIRFVRMRDLLRPDQIALAKDSEDISEEEYVAEAPPTRAAFLSTDIGAYDVDEHIKSDVGVLRTYQGYMKFLQLDLERPEKSRTPSPVSDSSSSGSSGPTGRRHWKKNIGTIAKNMLANGARFSALVERGFPMAIRLSIHHHTNSGPKFALQVFPNLDKACTPWHNVVVLKRDGSLVIEHNEDVDIASHELIYRYGRPYYYREIDPAMQGWGTTAGGSPSFEPLHPFGVLVRAPVASGDGAKPMSWADLPMEKVRELAKGYSLVIFRGFGGVGKDTYVTKAKQMGEVQSWVFGDVLEVKDDPSMDLNNVLTREAMPMHFDGLFKTKHDAEGTLISDPPTFQMFQCLNAPPPSKDGSDAGGRTLFTNTRRIYEEVFAKSSSPFATDVKNKQWRVFTPTNKSFGGSELRHPISTINPLTGHYILRWHEKWPQHITTFKPTMVEIIGLSEERSNALSDHITELLYDRRFVYEHTWETGDFLIADNIEVGHSLTIKMDPPLITSQLSSCIRGLRSNHARENYGESTSIEGDDTIYPGC